MRYKIEIVHLDGKRWYTYFTTAQMRKAGNIINLVKETWSLNNVKCINVRDWNPNTRKHYWEVSYDARLEELKGRDIRVEVEYEWGEKLRCYIGKSLGWIPIYLEIKRRDSSGGCTLCASSVVNIKRM